MKQVLQIILSIIVFLILSAPLAFAQKSGHTDYSGETLAKWQGGIQTSPTLSLTLVRVNLGPSVTYEVFSAVDEAGGCRYNPVLYVTVSGIEEEEICASGFGRVVFLAGYPTQPPMGAGIICVNPTTGLVNGYFSYAFFNGAAAVMLPAPNNRTFQELEALPICSEN